MQTSRHLEHVEQREERVFAVADSPESSLLPSRVDIDADAIAHNMRLIKLRAASDMAMMAVVKANAYGHGALTVARAALANGANYLAVANLAEALQLRRGGIDGPILVLGYVNAANVPVAVDHKISLSLIDVSQAIMLQAAARRADGLLKTHIKVDTGMGRLGILPTEADTLWRELRVCDQLYIEGIYTHFSVADEDQAFTQKQSRVFERVLSELRRAGLRFRYIHGANSAATIKLQGGSFNMIRPGLLLYGLKPFESHQMIAGLKPAMSWKTQVAQVKTLPPDSPVGYGQSYRTRRKETIAVLPVGYADGMRRSPTTWREVLVHGQRAPLVGRVSMEKTTINVSHIGDVRAGDEVVLLGRQGYDEISADEIAGWIGSINYEVLTSVMPRIPRQ